ASTSRSPNTRASASATGATAGRIVVTASGGTSPGHDTWLCYTEANDRSRCRVIDVEQEAPVASLRVAIIGVGNCASSLVQGIQYYRDVPDDGFIPGLMHPRLDGYHVRDIEFSAGFDIDARKVGRDLSEAIFEAPNNTVRFAEV